MSIRVAGVNWRFDGERAFVARGGAWLGAVQAAWPMAELAVDSTSAHIRSRPGGLFEDVEVARTEVAEIVVRRGALGHGISFQRGRDRGDELVFWPTHATPVLDALRERGWPVDG